MIELLEKRDSSDLRMTQAELQGYIDTARMLAYEQCNDGINYYLNSDAEDRLEHMQWCLDRKQFFQEQDDMYHLDRIYGEYAVYKIGNFFYREDEYKYGHW